MKANRNAYARKALDQIPRLLGNQDRNPYSPTYGCFHRDYWLDKTSDFPDAVRQFATHALALVYVHDFPGSIYRGNPKIRDWAIAGLNYWASIQHSDGSFDEFYPYERGWVGPTAFTTFTSIESYKLLKDEMPNEIAARVREAIRKAAYFVAAGESEEDHLANHHAMACLTVWKAYELLEDDALKEGFGHLWKGFLGYHNADEGWSREYDGVDPGYLSATVSFLGKIYQSNPDPAILEVLRQSAKFAAYFVYPNGFYGGSMGSRNTLHFYPHGFEIIADEVPLAASIAERMLVALGEDKLVPPAIISDRYVVYRVPEFLQAYLDYAERPAEMPPLPYEREPFTEYFPQSRIHVSNTPEHYTIANLAKGGVVKVFERETGNLIENDCGLIGRMRGGDLVSSQWVDPSYEVNVTDDGWEVRGPFNVVPSTKLFSPFKLILFRAALIAMGWNPTLAHWLKGQIRKTLILGQRPAPARFRRRLRFEDGQIVLEDEVTLAEDAAFEALSVGDEFFVRYVPQSRYFQVQELDVSGINLSPDQIDELNTKRHLHIMRTLAGTDIEMKVTEGKAVPFGVYGEDYYAGRRSKRALIYRLNRRTDEVERALRTYIQGKLQVIVDVGTADSLMLEKLRERLGALHFLGLDYSIDLLKAIHLSGIYKAQADAETLPVNNGTADAVIATAIIEHIPDPDVMIAECRRVLRPGGLIILTTPDPKMDEIASRLGLLKDAGHQVSFTLKELADFVAERDFEVVEAKKFMFSPVGFPFEKTIERIFGPLGLNYVMANQLVVGRRK